MKELIQTPKAKRDRERLANLRAYVRENSDLQRRNGELSRLLEETRGSRDANAKAYDTMQTAYLTLSEEADKLAVGFAVAVIVAIVEGVGIGIGALRYFGIL